MTMQLLILWMDNILIAEISPKIVLTLF